MLKNTLLILACAFIPVAATPAAWSQADLPQDLIKGDPEVQTAGGKVENKTEDGVRVVQANGNTINAERTDDTKVYNAECEEIEWDDFFVGDKVKMKYSEPAQGRAQIIEIKLRS